jgi:nitroreductase
MAICHKKDERKYSSARKLDYILEAARLAPSSSGLQPYPIFVISNKELREKIKPIALNQSQITDSSHILVFAVWDCYTLEKLENIFHKTLNERGLPLNKMDDYKKMMWKMYEPLSQEWHTYHATKQAYISLGLALVAAAEQKVDATPMEGFNPSALDDLLELKQKGLKSAVILALGYRDEANDYLVKLKKVRTSKNEFTTQII